MDAAVRKSLKSAFREQMAHVFPRPECDKESIEEAIHQLYTNLGKPVPMVIHCDGPGEYLHSFVADAGEPNSSWGKNISPSLFGYTLYRANSLKLDLEQCAVPAKDLRALLFWDLNRQLSRNYWDPLLLALRQRSLWPTLHKHKPAISPIAGDADWLYFYRICGEQPGMKSRMDLPRDLLKLMDAGLFYLTAFEHAVLACSSPEYIMRDGQDRLHGEAVAAVKWRDGTALYFHAGVNIPAKLIEDPESIDTADIAQERNAEVRRCFLEILGAERFSQILGLHSLDRDTDAFGHPLELFRTRYPDKLVGDYIYFATVVCPSTARRYFLCVPPHLRSAREAVAWTFGKSPEEYKPEIET